MEYILMNKNYALAHVKLSIDGHIDNILDIYNAEAFPISRKNVSDILTKYNIIAPTVLAQKGFGLSLSDQYWIKPVNTDMEWKDINYFDNPFSEDIGKIFFYDSGFSL